MSKPSSNVAKKFRFEWIYLLVGICMLGWGVPKWMDYRQTVKLGKSSEYWQKTPAKVISSHLERVEHTEGDPHWVEYIPRVTFEYSVNGQKYTSNVVQYGLTGVGREYGQELTSELGHRPWTVVYFNPEMPSQAVLFKGVSPGIRLDWVFPAVMIFAGLFYVSRGAVVIIQERQSKGSK